MRHRPDRWLKAVYSILAVLFLALAPFGTVAADTRPYLKATGADTFSGGWFNNGNNLCDTSTSSNYQDSNYSSSSFPADSQNRYGGVLTFAKDSGNNSAGGSSSEFAALALGEIEGNDSGLGFYSSGSLAKNGATAKNYLSFANFASLPPANYWGGLLIAPGTTRQTAYCVPDYYNTKIPSPLPGSLPGGQLTSGTPSDSYSQTAMSSPFDLMGSDSGGSDVIIAAGTQITIYIKGSTYISHNITYGSYGVDTVPKFSLVVQGSIYIGRNVTRLDGVYIAQSDPTDSSALRDDTGDIWTCHDDNTAQIKYTDPAHCSNRLVINGALVAKQIQLMRTPGDIATASTSEDGFAAAASSGAAEVINYMPAMVVGGPFFNDTSSHSEIDSLISLPPVF